MLATYEERLKREIAHYERVFKGRMSQEVPPVWLKVEAHFADRIKAATGAENLYAYVARHVEGRRSIDVLGLGSGACGNELDGIAPLLRSQECEFTLTCIDINEAALEQAEYEASNRGVRFRRLVQDINRMRLEEQQYDVIVAYASLHHFLALDHIAAEVNRALKPGGIFVTVDIPTRNGYLMWDETLEVVNTLWGVLPPKYKIAHTGFPEPTFVPLYENIDYSASGFECINSEAILPALRSHLHELAFVPALSIARRFLDTRFGANYDLNESLDAAISNFIMQMDAYYLQEGILKPETFFGAYGKRTA